MARLVLDTNSLIQCISRRSLYHDLWLSLIDGRNTLCVSTDILEEYAEILGRKSSARFAELALDVITNNPYTLFVTWKSRAHLTPEGKAALTPENLFVLTPVKS